ncbi:MAG: 30S ribosomal protein S17e [Candidatus Bathyarchaeota archaeon]|nr:MAG: 30S ribosomal protein S17e [Candidatus Bathyarchaeota archaeon]
MGKVRPERVKRIAKELVQRFPDKFTTDFENNKKLVEDFIELSSVRLRNRIAGYVTRLVSIGQKSEKADEEVAVEDEIEE